MMLELQSEYRIDADQASSSVIEDPSKIRICSSSELAIWLRDDRQHVVLLDCRPTSEANTTFAGAQKILLPTVLMRRLQNGTLSPGSLAPQLAEQTQQIRVIIIPDRCEKSVMASKVYEMLNKRGFDVVCFDEEPEDFARHFPSLVESTNFTAPRKKGGLNLCLLADKFSENVIKPSADRGFPAKIFHCVYLGNDETAKNKELLKSFGISYVINVTSDLPNYYETDSDFHYLRIPVDDSHSHNLAKYFPDAIAFIEKARAENTSVLVHCMAGISRSVTVCLAYLMYIMQCSLDDAFDRLLHQNASIQPNFHFMESLLCWEREIRKQIHGYVDENSTLPSSNSSAASSTCSSA